MWRRNLQILWRVRTQWILTRRRAPQNQNAEDENKSILKLHANHHHNRREVNFIMKVADVHPSCLDRHVTERVNIENLQGPILMNRRNEMGGVRVDRMQYRRWGGD